MKVVFCLVGILSLLLAGCVEHGDSIEGQYIVPKKCRVTKPLDFKDVRSRQRVARDLQREGVRITQIGESTTLTIPVELIFTTASSINRMASFDELKGEQIIRWVAGWIKSYAVESVEVQGREYVDHPTVYQEGLLKEQANRIRESLTRHGIDARLVYATARLAPMHETNGDHGDMSHVIRISFRYLHQGI